MRKLIIVVVVLALLAGGVSFALGGMKAMETTVVASETEPTLPPVEAGDLVVAEAKVVPVQYAELSLPTDGLVTEVLVAEGDQVEAGQVLLRLNAAQQAAAIAQAEAQLRRAQAQLDELRAGARPQQIAQARAAVEAAQARLAQVKEEAYPEEIAAARAELAAAQAALQEVLDGPSEDEITVAAAELRRAEITLKQAQEAYDEVAYMSGVGMLPQAAELEQATISYEAALANYNLAVEGPTEADIAAARSRVAQSQDNLARLLRGGSEADIAAAEAEIRRAQAELDLLKAEERPETIAVAEASVAAAQAELERAKAALAETELRAPFSGTVVSLEPKAGEYVAPGISLAQLADLSAWEIETEDLTELSVVNIRDGDLVTITVDAFPDLELAGRVTRIKAVGENKQGDIVYTVIVKPDRHDGRLRWNMTTAVTIEPGSSPSVEESVSVLPTATPTSVSAPEMAAEPLPTATPWTSTEPEVEAEKPTVILPSPTATSLALLSSVKGSEGKLPLATPTLAPLKAEVVAWGLHVRSGPGLDYPSLGHLKYGQEVEVLGGDPVSGWLQITYPEAASGTAWISGKEDYVRLKGSLETVPIVTAPGPSPSSSAASGGKLSGKLVFQTASGGDIYVINADGTGLKRLTYGLDPALSPDGTQVAFTHWGWTSDGRGPGLYMINVDGTGERQVFGAPQVKAPVWSPDGRRIAFTYQHGGPLKDWDKYLGQVPNIGDDGQVMRDEEGNPKMEALYFNMPADPWWKLGTVRLEDEYFQELYCHDHSYSPTWSPDGEWIVYASDKGIYRTREEDATSALTRDPNIGQITGRWRDRSPSWSPDGTRLAFQYRSHDHYEIMIMNADGSGQTLLTKSPVLARTPINSVSPAWSPDGQHIVYLTDARGRWELFVMNADGSGQRPLFEGALDDLTFEYHNVDERVVNWGL